MFDSLCLKTNKLHTSNNTSFFFTQQCSYCYSIPEQIIKTYLVVAVVLLRLMMKTMSWMIQIPQAHPFVSCNDGVAGSQSYRLPHLHSRPSLAEKKWETTSLTKNFMC